MVAYRACGWCIVHIYTCEWSAVAKWLTIRRKFSFAIRTSELNAIPSMRRTLFSRVSSKRTARFNKFTHYICINYVLQQLFLDITHLYDGYLNQVARWQIFNYLFLFFLPWFTHVKCSVTSKCIIYTCVASILCVQNVLILYSLGDLLRHAWESYTEL